MVMNNTSPVAVRSHAVLPVSAVATCCANAIGDTAANNSRTARVIGRFMLTPLPPSYVEATLFDFLKIHRITLLERPWPRRVCWFARKPVLSAVEGLAPTAQRYPFRRCEYALPVPGS